MLKQLKSLFNINEPINTSRFSTLFIFVVLVALLCKQFSQHIHWVSYTFDVFVFSIPTTYLLSLIYTKRFIDINKRIKAKIVFLAMFLLLNATIFVIVNFLSLALTEIKMLQNSEIITNTFGLKLKISLFCQILLGIPVTLFSFYLLFKNKSNVS